ncbi:thiolase domain-containing protein [Desulfurococcus mucosus]|uniref:Propanoyl-CoA C-acyltransferase n=1 Tax=Desulfurococcus mucosus (strain ATCC 35584 / DSM 2162 / JCM 9187 / O7/1) TaxID=765177 RepID=E8R876_DESM0|nr:thiolase domain-containing protein [Desulfurococcus mucosus]ADV64702.1 Propanoyl-CoA C-acyltransferase [Desulfurococcus mucosus DSM 2162]
MEKVFIVGVGMTKIGRFYEQSGRELFSQALWKAIEDAGGVKPRALVVGNMMSSTLMNQDSLGALLADYAGLRGIPAFKVEAACGSGGAALYAGYALVKSGVADVVAVGGLEKQTEATTPYVTRALAQAADADFEVFYGVTFTGLNAMIARLYMQLFGYSDEDLSYWPLKMHEYASYNPYAQLPRKTSMKEILDSPVIADPIRLFHAAPIGDGAAAVILVRGEEKAREIAKAAGRDTLIEVAGVGMATDSVDIASRNNLVVMEATAKAAQEALRMAGIGVKDVDYAEVHDAFHVTGYAALEDIGFAPKGEAPRLFKEGRFQKGDKPEVNFSGGLKARGHPVGATGVYQVAEAVMQLRGDFPGFKASSPETALTHNMGGVSTITVVSVLRRWK